MGGSYTPAPAATSNIYKQYAKYLPQMMQETTAGIPGIADAALTAAQQTQPGYNALNLAQLQQYALPEAIVGQQVANSNALAGARTNLAQLQGPGGQAATVASNLENRLNPAYAAAQKGAAAGVNAINLGGLSPGEAAATERSLNQSNQGTGNLGVLNPTNTISNALNFGGAFNNKIGLMNNATNAASNAANAGGFNPVNVALGQPNTSTAGNFGTSMMSPASSTTQAGASNSAFNFGSNLTNDNAGIVNAELGQQNAAMSANTQMSIANSPTSYLGAICCFIFLEAYRGNIPKTVRHGRDKYYFKNHDIATGYRRMARWLVPLMQKSNLIRALVWFTMVKPITDNLVHIRKPTKSRIITHAWLRVWAILGKGKNESAYAMTWSYPGRRTA